MNHHYHDFQQVDMPWFDQVPEHWSMTRVGLAYQVSLGKMLQSSPKSNSDQELPYLRSANVQAGAISIEDLNTMWFSPAEISELTLKAGDLMITEGGDIGRCAMWNGIPENCLYQNSVHRVRAKDSSTERFLFYWMNLVKNSGYLDVISNKATIAHLTVDKLNTIPVPLPPRDEQIAIAAFLDHETGKIDELIAEQEKLIALLDEKRQAVISHAVTKGLNPNVKMKDSGIEWLGEVPAHWTKEPLCHIALKDGGVFIDGDWIESPEIVDEGIRYLTNGNVGQGSFKQQGSGHITEESFERLNCTAVRPGDILISRLNLPAGRACLVPDIAEIMVTAVDNVITRPSPAYDRRFLVYMLSSDKHYANTENIARGTTMQRISRSSLGKIRFATPPLEEQVVIANYVDAEVARLKGLSSLAEEGASLLKERRSALISAAVTGKIDVRNHPAAVAALNKDKEI